MKYFFILFFALSIGLSCKKISIKGYTMTDGLGVVMGQTDPSDWTFDGSWTSKETAIFSSIDPGDLSGTSVGIVTVNPAFPNPCSNTVSFCVMSTSQCKLRVAIVNSKADKLRSSTISVANGLTCVAFQVTGDGFKRGNLYRVYYAFDAEGNLQFKKGHGDIMVQ